MTSEEVVKAWCASFNYTMMNYRLFPDRTQNTPQRVEDTPISVYFLKDGLSTVEKLGTVLGLDNALQRVIDHNLSKA